MLYVTSEYNQVVYSVAVIDGSSVVRFFLMNYLEHCDGANDPCVAGMESLHG